MLVSQLDGFELKQVRVVRRASGWYAMLIQAWRSRFQRMPYGEPVGIDLGLLNFLATSTGETIADQTLWIFKVS